MYIDHIQLASLGDLKVILLIANMLFMVVWSLWRYFNPEKYAEQLVKEANYILITITLACLIMYPLILLFLAIMFVSFRITFYLLGDKSPSILKKDIRPGTILTMLLLVGVVVQDVMILYEFGNGNDIFTIFRNLTYIYLGALIGTAILSPILAYIFDFFFPGIVEQHVRIRQTNNIFGIPMAVFSLGWSALPGGIYAFNSISYAILFTLLTLIISGVLVI